MGIVEKLLLLLLVWTGCLVPGVKADSDTTALIATGCVVGVLLLTIIFVGLFHCFLRRKRNQDKEKVHVTNPKLKPFKPTANGIANGAYRGPRGRLDALGRPLPPWGKASTQHMVPARHRPPLTFYTLRQDPRDMGLVRVPQSMPAGPSMVAAPPSFGRPVLYLDMLDTVAGGSKVNGTVPRNANGSAGGVLIREVESGDDRASMEERYRRKEHKKSRGRSKSRTRADSPSGLKERSRSRSRDATATAERESRRRQRHSGHSMDETPILARPGDIILSESVAPTESVAMSVLSESRSPNYNAADRAVGGFISTTSLQQRGAYSMTFDNDIPRYNDTLERPSSYFAPSTRADDTFDTPTADYTASNPTLPDSDTATRHTNPQNELELEPDSEQQRTPRADYLHSLNSPYDSEPPTLKRTESGHRPEPTPRADYIAVPGSSTDRNSFNFADAMKPYSPPLEKSMEVGGSFEAILNSVNLNGDGPATSGQSRPPPTPPYDGDRSPRDSVYPARGPSLRQIARPGQSGPHAAS